MTFKNNLASLVVGIIFGIGLALSGMTQPGKVIGFLDLFGQWDPSLIFVMGGAVLVHFVTYHLIRHRTSPLLTTQWHLPNKKDITPSLIIGSSLFGIGWGLGGYCPGPAVTSLMSFSHRPLIFVGSMILGMVLFKFVDSKLQLRR
jgi:uncharacterized protein